MSGASERRGKMSAPTPLHLQDRESSVRSPIMAWRSGSDIDLMLLSLFVGKSMHAQDGRWPTPTELSADVRSTALWHNTRCQGNGGMRGHVVTREKSKNECPEPLSELAVALRDRSSLSTPHLVEIANSRCYA